MSSSGVSPPACAGTLQLTPGAAHSPSLPQAMTTYGRDGRPPAGEPHPCTICQPNPATHARHSQIRRANPCEPPGGRTCALLCLFSSVSALLSLFSSVVPCSVFHWLVPCSSNNSSKAHPRRRTLEGPPEISPAPGTPGPGTCSRRQRLTVLLHVPGATPAPALHRAYYYKLSCTLLPNAVHTGTCALVIIRAHWPF